MLFNLSDLFIVFGQMGILFILFIKSDIRKNCQDLRNSHHTTTETWIIDPDGTKGEKPFPAYCEMTYDPPLGVTVSIYRNIYYNIHRAPVSC